MSSTKKQQILIFPFFLTVKSVIPVELPEGKSGQQAFAIEKLQKRAELLGATKTGTWCVNCETYQAITTFSKSVFLSDLLIKGTEIVLFGWGGERQVLIISCVPCAHQQRSQASESVWGSFINEPRH